MEVHLTPELEAKLNEIAVKTGRAMEEVVQDAMAAYLEELAEVRGMLDRRYDNVKSGSTRPVNGESFFESLRQREDELLKQRSSR